MDVSLNELIKSKKFSVHGGGRRGDRGQGDARDGTRGDSSGGGSDGDGVRSNGAGGGRMHPDRSMAKRNNRFSPYSRGDVNAPWTHERRHRQQFGGGHSPINIYKIVISNLDFGVTATDIKEIFGKFGPLKTVTVHYDRYGRALGTADVVFIRRNSALQATRQYNYLSLVGHPMKIELAANLSIVANFFAWFNGPGHLPTDLQGIGGAVGGFRGNTKGGRDDRRGNAEGRVVGGSNMGFRNKKQPLTKNGLDAQLDSFIRSQNN